MGKLQIITFTHPTHKFNTVKEARTQQLTIKMIQEII